MQTHNQILTSVIVAFVMFIGSLHLSSCSNSTTPATNNNSGKGTLRMYLTDAPAAYDSVVIYVTGVEVNVSADDSISGWSEVNGETEHFDLLVYRNGARAVLGTNDLVAGHYSQIRLIIGAGSYVVDGGIRHDLIIPSGMESGIKLKLDATIVAGQTYELLLDFDADRSIHVTGNGKYMMNPVIRATAVAATGSISGFIVPPSAHTLVWTNIGGDTISTVADYVTGGFVLSGLLDESFAVHCEPADAAFRDTVLVGVPVVKLQQTLLGTVALRLW